jgi:hypothetical protein
MISSRSRWSTAIKVTNTGELPLLNVQVCDSKLLADANAAGFIGRRRATLCQPIPRWLGAGRDDRSATCRI